MNLLANIAIAGGLISVLLLGVLHITSPEFQPGWRMISEYALGKHKRLLTFFFLCWGISTMVTALFILGITHTTWAIVGAILVFITGVGAVMGGLFDVKHKLHGLAFGLGVPFLPVGSLLVAYQLLDIPQWRSYQSVLLISSHAIWVSVVFMSLSMMLLFSGFKKAGLPLDKNAPPPDQLPEGVIGINGYVNRALVLCYIFWCVLISIIYQIN